MIVCTGAARLRGALTLALAGVLMTSLAFSVELTATNQPLAYFFSPADPPWTQVADLPGNVGFVDIADAVCSPTFCSAEIGSVQAYLDDNHLTASYSTSMAPLLHDPVINAITTGRRAS